MTLTRSRWADDRVHRPIERGQRVVARGETGGAGSSWSRAPRREPGTGRARAPRAGPSPRRSRGRRSRTGAAPASRGRAGASRSRRPRRRPPRGGWRPICPLGSASSNRGPEAASQSAHALPEEPVEAPDDAVPDWRPRLEGDSARRALLDRSAAPPSARASASPRAAGSTRRRSTATSARARGPPDRSAARRTRTGSRKFALYWIQSRWTRRLGTSRGSMAPSATRPSSVRTMSAPRSARMACSGPPGAM